MVDTDDTALKGRQGERFAARLFEVRLRRWATIQNAVRSDVSSVRRSRRQKTRNQHHRRDPGDDENRQC